MTGQSIQPGRLSVEVFVRCCPLNEVRFHLACATIAQWLLQPDALVHVILAKCPWRAELHDFCNENELPNERRIELPMARFWTTSKQAAEDAARGRVYVLADDDHLIVGDSFSGAGQWLRQGVGTILRHDKFGLVSGFPTTVNPGPATVEAAVGSYESRPPAAGVFDGLVLVKEGCVGAPYFMQKGAIGTFPDSAVMDQDMAMCRQLRERGWLVGQCYFCRYNHTGLFLTTAWPGLAVEA